MPWPWRRALPPEVRSLADLRTGERVLAHSPAQDGHIVATTLALHLPAGQGQERLPWGEVEQARWEEEGLVVVRVSGEEHTYAIDAPGRLPEVVHERVTASIAVNSHVPLPGGGGRGVRLSARRIPGETAVSWHMRFDPGVDSDDPEVQRRARAALAELRERMGL